MPVEAGYWQRRGRNRHIVASRNRHRKRTCVTGARPRCSRSQSVLPSMSAFPMSIHRLHVLVTRCLSKLGADVKRLRHAGQAYTETPVGVRRLREVRCLVRVQAGYSSWHVHAHLHTCRFSGEEVVLRFSRGTAKITVLLGRYRTRRWNVVDAPPSSAVWWTSSPAHALADVCGNGHGDGVRISRTSSLIVLRGTMISPR
jgi:hypothetical protein